MYTPRQFKKINDDGFVKPKSISASYQTAMAKTVAVRSTNFGRSTTSSVGPRAAKSAEPVKNIPKAPPKTIPRVAKPTPKPRVSLVDRVGSGKTAPRISLMDRVVTTPRPEKARVSLMDRVVTTPRVNKSAEKRRSMLPQPSPVKEKRREEEKSVGVEEGVGERSGMRFQRSSGSLSMGTSARRLSLIKTGVKT